MSAQKQKENSLKVEKRKKVTEQIRKVGRNVAEKVSPRRVRRFFAELGPGLITGAADDDPS